MNFDWKTEYHRYHRYFFNLQKKARTSQTRSFVWLSLTIFTVSFFAIVAIKPTLVTIAKLNKEIQDQKEASKLLQSKIDSIITAQQEFTANMENIGLLEEALPEKNEFPKLAYFFEQISQENEVTLQSLSFEKIGSLKKPAGTSSLGPANSLNFSLGVSGSYAKLKSFLSSLESSRRVLTIQRTNFGQTKKENNFEILLIVSGTTFFDNIQ